MQSNRLRNFFPSDYFRIPAESGRLMFATLVIHCVYSRIGNASCFYLHLFFVFQ